MHLVPRQTLVQEHDVRAGCRDVSHEHELEREVLQRETV